MAQQVPESVIQGHLEKVLSSQGFVGAGRLGPFLRFLVEQTVAGEGQKLKEAVIGVEVFQRPPDYDPRIDPIVRVEARRLRKRLRDYYEGPGAGDPVRIELPKGTYVPAFKLVGSGRRPAGSALRRRRVWAPALAALILASVAGAAWWVRSRRAMRADVNPSIAVLPFVNLSADPANEYFSDGLTEELIDALTKVAGLRVVARSSAFQFKGTPHDVREVAEKLQVSAVVEGSVRKSGDRLRITAQLVNADDGYHLWSQTYERELRDIFAIQEEISRAIVNALRVQLRVDLGRPLARRYSDNLEAYNLYLKGRYHWNLYTDEGIHKAVDYFEQAIRVDPGYAPAYAMLAHAYALMGYYKVLPPEDVWPKARDAAQRAIAIDGTLAEAHAALGFVLGLHFWDWAASEKAFRQALELNPASADAHGAYAVGYLLPHGRLDEANSEFDKALRLDPLAVFVNYAAAFSLLASGEHERAIEQYRKTLELHSGHPDMWWDLAMAYGYNGRGDEAMKAFQKSGLLREGSGWRLGPIEYALMGDMDQARKIIDEVDRTAEQRNWRAIDMARTHAVLGNKDRAFYWLEKAFQVRDPQLVWLKADPRFRNLRGDARLEPMLRKIGL